MIIKILLVNSLLFEIALSSQSHQNFIESKGDESIAQPNLNSPESKAIDDILTAESKKIGYVKEDVLVDKDKFGKANTRRIKGDRKFIKSHSDKSDKKSFSSAGKIGENEGFAKDNKIGKYVNVGKYDKKYGRKGALNRYGATGYNKKFGSVKEFGLNQDFTFGRNGAFYDSGTSAFDYGKKDGIYGARVSDGFKKTEKGGKRGGSSVGFGRRSKKTFAAAKSGSKKDINSGRRVKQFKSLKSEAKKL